MKNYKKSRKIRGSAFISPQKWPRSIMKFTGCPEMPRFEPYRKELIEQGLQIFK